MTGDGLEQHVRGIARKEPIGVAGDLNWPLFADAAERYARARNEERRTVDDALADAREAE